MEDITAYRLNELFKRWAADKKLIRSEMVIAFTTATGSKVSVHPSTPHDAASYLRSFLKRDDRLFMPGDVRCDTRTESLSRPGSILFRGFGFIRDNSNREHYRTALHLKFTGVPNPDQIGEMEARSYVSFDEHFGDDPMEPMHSHTGPTIHEFIRILEAAGNDWHNMYFKTQGTRMSAGHTPIQRIK